MCNKLPNKSLELKAVGWAYFRERERERKRERERVCVFEREIDSLPDDNQPMHQFANDHYNPHIHNTLNARDVERKNELTWEKREREIERQEKR